eukprot:3286442-Prymnesium_polylepis.1
MALLPSASAAPSSVLDLPSSNGAIRSLIAGDKPFLVGRLGLGSEPVVADATLAGKAVSSEWLSLVQTQAGVCAAFRRCRRRRATCARGGVVTWSRYGYGQFGLACSASVLLTGHRMYQTFARLYSDAVSEADLMARWSDQPTRSSARGAPAVQTAGWCTRARWSHGTPSTPRPGRSCESPHAAVPNTRTAAAAPRAPAAHPPAGSRLTRAAPHPSDRLANRTVLVVHPFDASIRTQFARRERVWPGERGARILPSLQLRTVQPVSSISGWRPDANWSQVERPGAAQRSQPGPQPS